MTTAPVLRRLARAALAILVQAAAILAPVAVLAAPDAPVPEASAFADNGDSIAVVIGNRSYKQTVPVDFAHNDAEAIRAYLVERLGYRDTETTCFQKVIG